MSEYPASGSGRDDIGAEIGRRYRAVAIETTPVHLDEAVLEDARQALRRDGPRRARGWTRPLAWAATIALSSVVLLDATRLPTPDAVPPAASGDSERPLEDIRGQADRIARDRRGENREPGMLSDPGESAGCPEERTRDAASWLQCIRELEAAGLASAATEQRRQRHAAFPDARAD